MGTVRVRTYQVKCRECGYMTTIKLGEDLGTVDAVAKAHRVHDAEKPDCRVWGTLDVEPLN